MAEWADTQPAAQATSGQTLAARLGYPGDARLVILHADDLGLCQGANRAFLELSAAGMVKSGSVMVPCAWAQEMLDHGRAQPDLDIGVHMTLTCEWATYRWGPLTVRDVTTGMVCDDGTFWPSTAEVFANAKLDAAAAELHTQVARVVDAGVAISHLDSHMGATWNSGLFSIYAALGYAHRVPVFYPQGQDAVMRRSRMLDQSLNTQARVLMSGYGMPMVDYVRITPCYTPDAPPSPSPEVYEFVLAGLEPGVTHFALHPNAPGEIELIDPRSAAWRIFEYEYFQSPRLARFLEQEGIIPIAYRDLQRLMAADLSQGERLPGV